MRLKLTMARREALVFYLLISPWVIGFLLFSIGPILASLGISFTQFDVVRPMKFIGVGNYATMIADELFWQSLKVTLLYTVFAVPLGIVVALFLASLLNQRIPALAAFRTLFYLPSVISGVAVSLLWMWLLNPTVGLVNYLLRAGLGIQGPKWLISGQWVIPAFVLMSLWTVGGSLILYLAALQSVPTELYEAASLDGATAMGRFWNVTLPMISPVVLFTFVTGMIGSFQVFTQSYVMTRGGPHYASLFYGLYIFQNAFQLFKMGYAAALAWILFIIIMSLSVLTLRLSSRVVYYQGGGERT